MTEAPTEGIHALLSLIKSRDLAVSSLADREASAIAAEIPGWSRLAHYLFFRTLIEACKPRRILICGVYHGRDICYIDRAWVNHGDGGPLEIVGVDLFSGEPCADWPEWHGNKSWETMGFGPHPTAQGARDNVDKWCRSKVRLYKANSIEFMRACKEQFDVIYLDTAHDYQTVKDEIAAAKPLLAGPHAIICGDDYADTETWGVKKAVGENFSNHAVIGGIIWVSEASMMV